VQGADQLSRSLTSATWHAMLSDRREDAYQTMDKIAARQGIDRIRMFNRAGSITFSTNAAEVPGNGQTERGCIGCHTPIRPLEKIATVTHTQVTNKSDGSRSLVMTTPIPNEPSCQASCHAHPAADKVLGQLELHLSLDAVDSELDSMRMRVWARVLVEILMFTAFILLFTERFVTRPLAQLRAGVRAIGKMNLDQPVKVAESSEEIDSLARAFEIMRVRLKEALDEIQRFTQTLETKVDERTRQLRAAQQRLQQSDRLASLGTLAASVAHEINNPISGVLNLSMLMQRILKDDGIPAGRVPEFRKYLGQVSHETARVGRIVSDLLAFSRRGKPQRAPTDLNRAIRSTVSLVDHKLKLANIALDLKLAETLPPVFCDGSQIQQVILNLVLNAAESMQSHGSGTVTVSTALTAAKDAAEVVVADQGEGIAEENLARIFDPFFTTKSDGKGVGLGLAVSYGIIQSHNGDIDVKSKLGEGTVFVITLPLEPVDAPQPAGAGSA
jgi:two-component system, NtrC family, sensor kinase